MKILIAISVLVLTICMFSSLKVMKVAGPGLGNHGDYIIWKNDKFAGIRVEK